jgi:hypothetical protein
MNTGKNECVSQVGDKLTEKYVKEREKQVIPER